MNPYDIERAFAEIEAGIISQMIARFRKDRPEGNVGGYEWKDWRIRQLRGIRKFIRGIKKQYRRQYKSLNQWIKRLIGKACDDAIASSIEDQMDRTPEGEFFNINRTRIDALQEATVKDLARVEGAVFRKTEDAYRQIVYKAQVALNSGAVTYEQAVDMATRDFLTAGINCIEYKNGSRHTVEEYARMVLRTTMKRAALMAEGEIRTQLGIHTVYARWRDMACPECMQFLARVMVDDVYSEGTREEAEAGGYLLLSDAMAQGFLHPNCKDTIATYDPERWKDDPENDPVKMSQAKRDAYMREAEEREKLEEKEYAANHRAETWGRIAKNQLTPDNKKRAAMLMQKARAERAEVKKEIREASGEPKRWFTDKTAEYFENAEPKTGDVIIEEGATPKKNEQPVAELIHDTFGGDIRIRKKSETELSPDYFWRGHLWELKTPEKSTKNAVDRRIREGLWQIETDIGGIILDISLIDMPLVIIEKIIRYRAVRSAQAGTGFIVVKGNKVLKVYEI